LEGGLDLARQRQLGSIREAIAGAALGMNPLAALARGEMLLCECLPNFYSDLEAEFQVRTQLSFKEYYTCLAALSSHYLKLTPETFMDMSPQRAIFNVNTLCEAAPHMRDIFAKYFAFKSQTPDELRIALWGSQTVLNEEDAGRFDYTPLRNRPVLR